MIRKALMICVFLILAVPAYAKWGSIHTMIEGDQAVDLIDIVQITTSIDGDVTEAWMSPDGNYIAYCICSIDKEAGLLDRQLRLLRLPDGKTSILLDSAPVHIKDDAPAAQEAWSADSVWWSPTSKTIAFPVMHVISDDAEPIREYSLVVMSTSGTRKATFPLPMDSYVTEVAWNPDGTKFVSGLTVQTAEDKHEGRLELFDTNTNSVQELVTMSQGYLKAYRWGGDGQQIQYISRAPGVPTQLKEITPDGKSDRVIINDYHGEKFSPNGRLKLSKSGPTLSVQDVLMNKTIDLGINPVGGFVSWTPKSSLLTYYTEQKIAAGDNKRSRNERLIWLAQVSNTKANHMCVAIDADDAPVPSWSNDCTKMAYTSGHRLYVARLGWRVPDPIEKLAAGITLTPEEQEELKAVVLSNGKQLGLAAMMYAADYNEKLTSFAGSDALWPYLPQESKDILEFPGAGGKPFYQEFEGSLDDLENPGEIPLFTIDAGYNWKVVAYADGHAEMKPK